MKRLALPILAAVFTTSAALAGPPVVGEVTGVRPASSDIQITEASGRDSLFHIDGTTTVTLPTGKGTVTSTPGAVRGIRMGYTCSMVAEASGGKQVTLSADCSK